VKIRTVAKAACESTGCPTIFVTDQGTVLVQGYIPNDVRLGVPAGELVVEIPRSLLLEGAAGLQLHE
jgi:hypothetical protein